MGDRKEKIDFILEQQLLKYPSDNTDISYLRGFLERLEDEKFDNLCINLKISTRNWKIDELLK